MTGKTHMAVGLSSCVVLTAIFPTTLTVAETVVSPALGILATIPGSLGPDIDISGSTASRKFPLFAKILTHRGFTHTLVIPAILYAILYYSGFGLMLNSQIFGFLFGWVMHIFADLLNRKGVPLFYPLSTRKVHIMTIRTGKIDEKIFLVAWCILCTVAYVYLKHLGGL